MSDDLESGYRRRLVLAYVESLAPALSVEETASVTRLPGDLRTTVAWVMLRRGTCVDAAPPVVDKKRGGTRRMLLAAALAILLLLIPAGL